jgi:hypothetical protein
MNVTVFGQVVADDSLGDVYMVPLCDILEDVKQLFNAREARLPESDLAVHNILRRGYNSLGALTEDIAAADLLGNEAGAALGPLESRFCSRCGSGNHTREICGVEIWSSDRKELKKVSVPSKAASRDPALVWAGEGTLVWFCSHCNTGPHCQWHYKCSWCTHIKCEGCLVMDYTPF